VSIASCETIPEGQTPKQAKELLATVKSVLEKQLNTTVVLRNEDTDWWLFPEKKQPYERATSLLPGKRFLPHGCSACKGPMELIQEGEIPVPLNLYWHCLACGRNTPYREE